MSPSLLHRLPPPPHPPLNIPPRLLPHIQLAIPHHPRVILAIPLHQPRAPILLARARRALARVSRAGARVGCQLGDDACARGSGIAQVCEGGGGSSVRRDVWMVLIGCVAGVDVLGSRVRVGVVGGQGVVERFPGRRFRGLRGCVVEDAQDGAGDGVALDAYVVRDEGGGFAG